MSNKAGMTLNDLRERTKAAHTALVLHRATLGAGRVGNMRETFVWAKALLERADSNSDLSISDPLENLLRRFNKAGELYYYAKKHGLQAAMLRKLSDAG